MNELKAAKNQALLREVNERLEEMASPEMTVEFLCECANDGCTNMISLTVEEYERVRTFPTRFAIAPGHNFAEFERIVESNERFAVIEKFGEGGRAAVRLDPRRRRGRKE